MLRTSLISHSAPDILILKEINGREPRTTMDSETNKFKRELKLIVVS